MSTYHFSIKSFIATILVGIVYLSILSSIVQAAEWNNKGTLITPRFWHTATLLNNGKVLVVGGESNGSRIKQTEIYDPVTGNWAYTAFPNDVRKDHTAHLVTVNKFTGETRVLIIGGSDSNTYANTAELYNPATNTWTSTPNMNNRRIQHGSSILDDGKIFVTGGYNPTVLNATEEYDPILNVWSNRASLNTARRLHAQVTFKDTQGNNKIMVIGGLNSNGNQLNSIEIYDPPTDTWTIGPDMHLTRFDFSAVVLHDGRILVVGGNTNNDNTSEVYNPASNSWTMYTATNAFKYGGTLALLRGGANYKALVAGGTNSANVQLFDPEINQWSTTISLNSPRSRFTLTTLNDGTILAIAGLNSLGQTNTSEVYTPDQLATPTPTPFLDLPFDYQSKGKSFDEVALNPESWFDHQYPLQNIFCCIQKVLIYTGNEEDLPYRSHNGYDYAWKDGVDLNTPVLAAAAGDATFVPESSSGGAGNIIKIDHGNGYQSWYEHLQSTGLIVSNTSDTIHVTKGQQIGLVGMTGNTGGPHIHLSVFNDENKNGIFTDDWPYGLVDPLGWEGKNTDPWTLYGTDKHGVASYNLFINKEQPKSSAIPVNGGTVLTDLLHLDIPSNAVATGFTVTIKNGPFESKNTNTSILPSFFIDAVDTLGNIITQLFSPATIIIDYKTADLLNINEDTLKLYSLNESTMQWEPLPSTVDTINKIVTTQTPHFSHFALMGEAKDSTPPTTTAVLNGNKGQDGWYRSSVSVELSPRDNDSGLGVHETLYSLNGNDWFVYVNPLRFEQEGEYAITYQSIDNAGNLENQKTTTFHIDKTLPEMKMIYDTQKQDIIVSGTDNSGATTVKEVATGKNKEQITITDQAGNSLVIDDKDRDHGANSIINFVSFAYNGEVTELNKNRFSVSYKEATGGSVKILKQVYELKGEEKIKLVYDQKTNKTTITQGKQKTEKDGLVFLQLSTNNGAIQYSY